MFEVAGPRQDCTTPAAPCPGDPVALDFPRSRRPALPENIRGAGHPPRGEPEIPHPTKRTRGSVWPARTLFRSRQTGKHREAGPCPHRRRAFRPRQVRVRPPTAAGRSVPTGTAVRTDVGSEQRSRRRRRSIRPFRRPGRLKPITMRETPGRKRPVPNGGERPAAPIPAQARPAGDQPRGLFVRTRTLTVPQHPRRTNGES